ncbi:MAG: hypothetical protein V8Q27_04050 [Eubacteriales bacterium]
MRGKKVTALMLSLIMTASLLGGCGSRAKVTEDMIPSVTDLRADGEAEAEASVKGLSMNKSYVAELTRLDGDNTEMASVDAKEVPVVLKATSIAKDLKVKIVNKRNDQVITGTAFEVAVTDSAKNKKNYKDDDKDGIIYIKSMEPGKCTISMKASGSYSAPADIQPRSRQRLIIRPSMSPTRLKKESEINAAKEMPIPMETVEQEARRSFPTP